MKTHLVLKKYFNKRRSACGYSLRSLAKRLEISAGFLSRILNGKKPVPYHLLLRLAQVLDIRTRSVPLSKGSPIHQFTLDQNQFRFLLGIIGD